MGIEQSGNVTPGHLAQWVTAGVLQDAGPMIAGQRVIASLRQAAFDSTADQPLVIPNSIAAFQLTGIIVANAPISLASAVGGFYTDVSKGGTPIVSAGQAYSALTGLNLLMQPTLTAFAQSARFSPALLPTNYSIYFSLTTPNAVGSTADIYLVGIDLT